MDRVFLRFCAQPPRHEPSPATGTIACARQTDRLAALVEAFCFHAHDQLAGDDGEPSRGTAQTFLADLGFDLSQVRELPVGLIVSPAAMKERLVASGFTRQEIHASKLLADQRLAGRLVGPIPDLDGQIRSFWAVHPRGIAPEYLFWRGRWKEEVVLFGLETALRASDDGPEQIVVIEDLIDSLLLRSGGMPNVTAVGGSVAGLRAARWQQLANIGVRSLTLVANNDRRVDARLLASVKAAFAAGAAPSIYLLPPGKLAPSRTVGQFVRRCGVEGFRSLLRRERSHAYRVWAMEILRRRRPRRGWTDASRRAAMAEAVAFYSAMAGRRRGTSELDAHFVPPIVEALGWPWGAAGPRVERRSAESGFCTLHRCGETDCFCFD